MIYRGFYLAMKAGFYLHIPFCLKKCGYCDFYSVINESSLIDKFLNLSQQEIKFYADHPIFSQCEFQTVYLGGGTPSILSSGQIAELVNKVQSNFQLPDSYEFTLEANPETLSVEKLKEYRSIGVNRLSIGVQSFSDEELKILNRIHDSNQALNSIRWTRKAGFDNINLDLIFAIPHQTISDWIKNLKLAISFQPEHISVYCLTIEQGTPLAHKISTGEQKKSEEETEREMYLKTIEILSNSGYEQYEISNFAKTGFACNHNLGYWNWSPYLGIGPSAHSFWRFHRQWNTRSIHQYFDKISNKNNAVEDAEELTDQQKMLEFIYLNLRKCSGIDVREFEDIFKISFTKKFDKIIEKMNTYQESRLLTLKNNQLKLTPFGFVIFDEICQQFAKAI